METFTHKGNKLIIVLLIILLIVSVAVNLSYKHYWNKANTKAEYYEEQFKTMYEITESENEVASACLHLQGIEHGKHFKELEYYIIE